jgi:hypothetical protein
MFKSLLKKVAGAVKCSAVGTETTQKSGACLKGHKSRINLFLGLILVMLLMTTGCMTVSRTGLASPIAYTEVVPDLIKAEFDFNLNEKKSGKASAWYLLNFWKVAGDYKFSEVRGGEFKAGLFGDRIAKVKSAAVYNALKEGDGDMIVAPQYDTETKSYLFGFLKSYKVTVKGYEATIKTLYQKKVDGEQVSVSIPFPEK